MMFSKTCEYALRAVIFITKKTNQGEKVSIKDVAAGTGSPEHFIAKILQILSRQKLISSAKGPNGGFFMTDENLKKSLSDIVIAVDGDRIFTQCCLGLHECSETRPCPVHYRFKPIRQQIKSMLDDAVLENFVRELNIGQEFLTFLN